MSHLNTGLEHRDKIQYFLQLSFIFFFLVMAYPGCRGIMAAGRVGYFPLSCALRCRCALNKIFTCRLLSVIVSEDVEPRHFGWLVGFNCTFSANRPYRAIEKVKV